MKTDKAPLGLIDSLERQILEIEETALEAEYPLAMTFVNGLSTQVEELKNRIVIMAVLDP